MILKYGNSKEITSAIRDNHTASSCPASTHYVISLSAVFFVVSFASLVLVVLQAPIVEDKQQPRDSLCLGAWEDTFNIAQQENEHMISHCQGALGSEIHRFGLINIRSLDFLL